ncbi:hypothetical protein ACFSSA_07475 [Luteolibacter algae]|uniref:Uncharacterized protein n=1 Tax=Luteolibacter algae TaxID=454151 RepID=A0ABW5DA17_9BACT
MSLSDRQNAKCYHGISRFFRGCKSWLVESFPFDTFSEVSKSFFEVIVTVVFTFIPFFFLSIKWSESEGANTSEAFSDTFYGYWQGGEIVLPILGLCGAIAVLLALNKGSFAWWAHALVVLVILGATIGGGAALKGSDGFNKDLNGEIITAAFVIYLFLAVLWLVLAAAVRINKPKPRESDLRAQDILRQVNERRAKPEA